MKRSMNRWTTTVAAASMLSLPVVGFANPLQDPAPQQQQQPQPTPQPEPQKPQPQPAEPRQPEPGRPQPTDPQPAQPQPQPAQPQPTEPQPSAQPASPASTPSQQTTSPQEHLSQARAAVESISDTSVPAKSRSQLAQLKRHLSTLEKAGTSSTGTAAAAPGASGKTNANWGTEVAAIDKIITEMVGGETTSATTPGATGTSGSSKAADAVNMDAATRSKLMEVRAHITAYAAGMAGTSTPKNETPKAEPPSAAPSAAASAPQSEPSPAASPAAASPAQPGAPESQPSPTPSAAAQQSQPPAAGEQPPAAGAQQPGAQPQIDADAARRHLMAARESLSQLTQLPAAQQLSGEARTQVAQLISNFNELISTQSNWRASYAKVSANLNALVGAENGDAEAAGGPPTAATAAPAPGATPTPGAAPTPGATAAPGAVGTSGSASVELDPAIRAKLVEFRHNLSEFQKASGG